MIDRQGGREGGRERGREGGRERGRERERETPGEGEREMPGERQGGREGRDEYLPKLVCSNSSYHHSPAPRRHALVYTETMRVQMLGCKRGTRTCM